MIAPCDVNERVLFHHLDQRYWLTAAAARTPVVLVWWTYGDWPRALAMRLNAHKRAFGEHIGQQIVCAHFNLKRCSAAIPRTLAQYVHCRTATRGRIQDPT